MGIVEITKISIRLSVGKSFVSWILRLLTSRRRSPQLFGKYTKYPITIEQARIYRQYGIEKLLCVTGNVKMIARIFPNYRPGLGDLKDCGCDRRYTSDNHRATFRIFQENVINIVVMKSPVVLLLKMYLMNRMPMMEGAFRCQQNNGLVFPLESLPP